MPEEAYGQLIPACQKTAAGRGVSFSQSYGASGEQSRAVAAGLDADVVAFSLAPDVASLVQLGFEVRVELLRDDGESLSAQLTREQVEALELQRGQIVYVRPTRQTVFQ